MDAQTIIAVSMALNTLTRLIVDLAQTSAVLTDEQKAKVTAIMDSNAETHNAVQAALRNQ